MTLLAHRDAPPAISDRRRNTPDRVLFITTLALSLLGLLMIYSATRVGLERDNLPASFSMERQMIFVAAGLILFVGCLSLTIGNWANSLTSSTSGWLPCSPWCSCFRRSKGAQRWFDLGYFQLQPSEFSKMACVIALAAVLGRPQVKLRWGRIGQALAVMAVPGILIFLQPDLGTMLVFAFVTIVMLFGAGISGRQILVLSGLGLASVVAVVQLGVLRDYQVNRIRVLMDPDLDPTGIGWNLRQSKLAVGSGQLTGKGLLPGSADQLSVRA